MEWIEWENVIISRIVSLNHKTYSFLDSDSFYLSDGDRFFTWWTKTRTSSTVILFDLLIKLFEIATDPLLLWNNPSDWTVETRPKLNTLFCCSYLRILNGKTKDLPSPGEWTNWVNERMVDWLIDWLIDWFISCSTTASRTGRSLLPSMSLVWRVCIVIVWKISDGTQRALQPLRTQYRRYHVNLIRNMCYFKGAPL